MKLILRISKEWSNGRSRGGITRSIIGEVHSSDIQGYQVEGESGVTLTSLMNFILGTSKKIKRKIKVMLLEDH